MYPSLLLPHFLDMLLNINKGFTADCRGFPDETVIKLLVEIGMKSFTHFSECSYFCYNFVWRLLLWMTLLYSMVMA